MSSNDAFEAGKKGAFELSMISAVGLRRLGYSLGADRKWSPWEPFFIIV